MTFREFYNSYQKRKKYFQTDFQNDLLKKAYIKLRKGTEIRVKDIQSSQQSHKRSISDLLIYIPQVERVKKEIYNELDEVEITTEADIRIIFGDYGHGKSQTANIIVEDIKASSRNNVKVYMENITTFRNFFTNFSEDAHEYITKYHRHMASRFEKYLSRFVESKDRRKISNSQLIVDFIEFINSLSKRGITLVLLLDEVDKIIHDEQERQQWINFFVSINDASDLSLLLVLFMPQKTSQDLIRIDKRMERWQTFSVLIQ